MHAIVEQSWRDALAARADGLDFGHPDDRAIFRQRVGQLCRMGKLSAINEAAALYGKPPARTRAAAVRMLADGYIHS